MATLLLQAAGAFLGGAFGGVGAAIGTAAGSIAGYIIDSQLIASTRSIEGPRLRSARPFSAEEGASIPRVYGTARLSGSVVIWATRFEEVRTTRRRGFKGGPKVTNFSYFANVAFALCEGEIAAIRRIWADGRELDLKHVNYRVYRGTEDQLPDPLLEAKQGPGNAPAYRGVSYIVFDRLPIDNYGNRIPQFSFEVIRPVGSFNDRIRAVALIPGSTEYGLSTTAVAKVEFPGQARAQNRNVLYGSTDLVASLDELQALCPNLEHVSLVVAWFGTDLRAGQCTIEPSVVDASSSSISSNWSVAGVTRSMARKVSTIAGNPAFGGTPSDRSVHEVIIELKSRGLKVTFCPFIMMDIPGGSSLADPYGGLAQAAYPWRGRITCDPAPGLSGTADKASLARNQIDAFRGVVQLAHFDGTPQTGFTYNGPATDWGYARFILHYGHLCARAGGVDSFLVGTEMVALTIVRDDQSAFPFVEKLSALAGDIKAVLGSETKVSYGADWSEYFGYHPQDGSGDVLFHLDSLWASPDIDAIGIDNYMPISDWRDSDHQNGNPDGFTGPYDRKALAASIASGEGYDWYYASDADRDGRIRTPITDGVYSKPWTFRFKDIVSWWSNQHFDRIGGIESSQPTPWVPRSKPIWFVELGCPAVDKGPNQPNVFSDPKSSESAWPYYSSRGRSDLAQRRFLEAHLRYWDESDADFDPVTNPESNVYPGRMLDFSRIYLWAWDARPFPAFPLRSEIWSDGANWLTGHWLNGRLSGVELGELAEAIAKDFGQKASAPEGLSGFLTGFIVDRPGSAREVLEPLLDFYGSLIREREGGIEFSDPAKEFASPIRLDMLISEDGKAHIETERSSIDEAGGELVLAHVEPMMEHRPVLTRLANRDGATSTQTVISLPIVLEQGAAESALVAYRRRLISARTSVSFGVPIADEGVSIGSVIKLPQHDRVYQISAIEDGLYRRVVARAIESLPDAPDLRQLPDYYSPDPDAETEPFALLLDLPMIDRARPPEEQLRIAIWRKPWRLHTVSVSPGTIGFKPRTQVQFPSTMGFLEEALVPGNSGRTDSNAVIKVRSPDSEFSSVDKALLLNGANICAVKALNGEWEVLQFECAEEISSGLWKLSNLLRGQAGTEDAAEIGAAENAPFVLLDDTVLPAGIRNAEIGLDLNFRIEAGFLVQGTGGSTIDVPGQGGIRCQMPLRPVHLRAWQRSDGSVDFTWIRRSRIDADRWFGPEIPLGEFGENYSIEILNGGEVVRSATSSTSAWTYTATHRQDDLGNINAPFDISVRQVSLAVGAGLSATLSINS